MSNNTAFVLSGGGAKGAFEVGAMEMLIKKKGIKPRAIYGTSAGALNALGLVFLGIDGTKEMWYSIRGNSDILGPNWWRGPWARAAYNLNPLREKLKFAIKGPKVNPDITAVACYVDQWDNSIHYAYSDQMPPGDFIKYVEASASIPAVMEPVQKKDSDGNTHYLVDGGVREQTPLKNAIDDGFDTIYVILCNPLRENMEAGWTPSFPPIIYHGLRAIEGGMHENFINDIRVCLKSNSAPDKKYIDLHIIAPDHLLIDSLEFSPTKIRAAIDQGYNSIPI